MDRRHFLVALSAVTVGAMGLTRCSTAAQPRATEATPVAVEQPPPLLPPPPRVARIPLPGGGMLATLPDGGDLLALTVDDGVSSDVVRLYTEFARDTGVRLTYFVNGAYRSWTENQALLRPLVDSGQIQLGNHTWSHPDLTKLPLTAVAEELRHTHDFLWKAYGVDARPYFRPPYGAHNANVDTVCGELGYTAGTLWSGSLEDHVVLPAEEIVKMAEKYFTPGSIVIGHLNHEPVTHVYGRLVDLIRERRLRTVTLNDVYVS
ncbi:polysaccharide deacetylase family protein [Mycobacterium sp. 1274761.0]|uniref:polysaccharide deacetylase family protein n=1 Tax=Mycobacterium sp. 1274761.0 TaxID=1834077 RepID=UPI000801221D|nr:polysaccharide deacetylase [Mycobacterium sp. 1274761.0]